MDFGLVTHRQTDYRRNTMHYEHMHIKDVLTSIPKSDQLFVTMAVIHVAGQRFLAVCEIRVS